MHQIPGFHTRRAWMVTLPASLLLVALLASGCYLVAPVLPPTSTPLSPPTAAPRVPSTPLPTLTPTPQNLLQVNRYELPQPAGAASAVNLLAEDGRVWVVDTSSLLWRLDPASGVWTGPVDLLEGSLPSQRPVEPRQLFLAAGRLWATLRGGGINRAVLLDPDRLAVLDWADLSGVDFNQGLLVGDKIIFPPNIYFGKTGQLLTSYDKIRRCYSYDAVGAIGKEWAAYWILGQGLGLVSVEYPNHCRFSVLPDSGLPGNFTLVDPFLWRIRYQEGTTDPLLVAFRLQDVLANAWDPLLEKEKPASQPLLQAGLQMGDSARPLLQPLLSSGPALWAFQSAASDGLMDAWQLDAASGAELGRYRVSLPPGSPPPAALSQAWVDGSSLWLPLGDSVARITLSQ